MQAGLERTSGPNYGGWIESPNWVRDALALRGQQLDHVRATVADRRGRLLQLGDNVVAHRGSFTGTGGPAVVGPAARVARHRQGEHAPAAMAAGTCGSSQPNLPKSREISHCGLPRPAATGGHRVRIVTYAGIRAGRGPLTRPAAGVTLEVEGGRSP